MNKEKDQPKPDKPPPPPPPPPPPDDPGISRFQKGYDPDNPPKKDK